MLATYDEREYIALPRQYQLGRIPVEISVQVTRYFIISIVIKEIHTHSRINKFTTNPLIQQLIQS
ncbi:MAG: hypothetical protein CME59_04510 [Halioglobus sp.]|nr:hypothetical protein [Halioglobus sp.]